MAKEHILIVDDDELVRTGLALDLEAAGYQVSNACSAEEAVRILEEHPIHLVLSDLMMGEMNGFRLLEHVRERMAGVGFIMITGHGSVDRALEAMRCGANDFVQKPANPDLIRQRVQAVLDDLRLQRSLIQERHKERQRQKAIQKKHLREERMTSLVRLADGVAAYLAGVLAPLFAHVDGADPSPDTLTQAKRKAQSFIHDLEIIGHGEHSGEEELRVDDLVYSMLETEEWQKLKRYAPQIQIKSTIESDLSPVRGIASQLQDMILNLVTYSLEGMPDGGLLRISVYARDVDETSAEMPDLAENKYVVIDLEDSAADPPAGDMDLLFEPFQSRRIAGQTTTTGLGLSVVYRIAQTHHGEIQVDAKPHQGTRYRIFLPVAASRNDASVGESPHLAGHETILVLDDHDGDREQAATLLEQLGYRVLRAASGKEALAIFQHAEAGDPRLRIDLAIIDLVLGDVFDGLETYKRIIEIKPDQLAILASGFAEYSRVAEAKQLGMRRHIQKPYRAENLGKAVRAELDYRKSTTD